jgi:hypothetical protein
MTVRVSYLARPTRVLRSHVPTVGLFVLTRRGAERAGPCEETCRQEPRRARTATGHTHRRSLQFPSPFSDVLITLGAVLKTSAVTAVMPDLCVGRVREGRSSKDLDHASSYVFSLATG